jgi:drug/metabolite transporter (DMT)-like permease
MVENIPYYGEIMSFATAVVWALAVIFFKKSGETVHPIGLNMFKNTLAMLLFIPTLWIFSSPLFRPVPYTEYLLLIASGALGIGIADTLFFMSLNRLGAGMSAIVDCLYSPFIITLSFIWLRETMSALQIIGALMIVSAVLTATQRKSRGNILPRDLLLGIIFGVAAMACMAVGIVMIKPLLNRSPLLWATEVRLWGGVIILGPLILLHPQRRKIVTSIFSVKSWKYTIIGSFLGAYVAMILWLAGFKYTQASTASVLNQTSNIFLFVFAAIFLKEMINRQRIIALLLGVAGAFIVTFG